MFTGIVEETGLVESVHPGDQSIRLTLSLRKTGAGLKVGDSVEVEEDGGSSAMHCQEAALKEDDRAAVGDDEVDVPVGVVGEGGAVEEEAGLDLASNTG